MTPTLLAQDSLRGDTLDGAKGGIKKYRINDIAYSPDGAQLAVASRDGIWLYDAQTGHELDIFTGHTGSIWNVSFSPDGRTITSAGQDRTIRIWDVNTGQNLQTYRHQVWDVAYSPDGKTIISGSWDKNLYLLDADTGKLLRTFSGHTQKVWRVAFSPDGRMIASASHDRTVRLWDVNTGQLLRILTEHTDQVWSVAFSPDGKTIMSGSSDGTCCLWNTNTGRPIRSFMSSLSYV